MTLATGMERYAEYHADKYRELASEGELKDANLNKARLYFQSEERTRTLRNQRSGMLNKGQLVSAYTGNQHVFKRDRTKKVLKNTRVQLMIDCSGSMCGDKVVYAAHTALQIIRLCSIMNVDTEAVGFSSKGQGAVHYLYKVFGKRLKRPEDFLKGFWRSMPYALNQNHDGDSILFGRRRLLKEGKQYRKIMFVLSDGMPACSRRGDSYAFAEKVIDMIEREPYIEIYGIGMMDRCVEALYSKCMVVEHIQNLEEQLLGFFKKVVYN